MATISSPAIHQAMLVGAWMATTGSSEGKMLRIGTGETSERNSRLFSPTAWNLVLSSYCIG